MRDRSIFGGSMFFGYMLEHRSLMMSVFTRPTFSSFIWTRQGFETDKKEGKTEVGMKFWGKGA